MDITPLANYIAGIPVWTKYLFYVWIMYSAVLLVALFAVNPNSTSSGSNQEIADSQSSEAEGGADLGSDTPLPKALSAPSIYDMRKRTEVRGLRTSENDMALYNLPNGIYGWVQAYQLNTPKIRVLNSPFDSGHPVIPMSLKVAQNKDFAESLELHKALNGTIYVIAYVTDQMRAHIENPSRSESVKTVLVFRKYNEYDQLLAVPRDRLLYWSQRQFGDGEVVADVNIQ